MPLFSVRHKNPVSGIVALLLYVYCQEGCKKALLGQEIVVEDYGGDVQAIPISALKVLKL